MANVQPLTACRLCRSSRFTLFFDLGDQPLANNLVPMEARAQTDYTAPLAVVRCEDCQHVQLTHTVPPEMLFSDYRYTSGTSEGWHDHSEALAEMVTRRRGTGFVVDIGANDGTLLSKFKRLGWKTLGVDPAKNLARNAPVRMEAVTWSLETAKSLVTDYRKADIIIAQNVLGHVHDPVDFLQGVAAMLKIGGDAIIEVPDLRHLLETVAFDTIYHEHLSYWSVVTLTKAAHLAGLKLVHVQDLKVHGGSLRVTLRHTGRPSAHLGVQLVYDYRRLMNPNLYTQFQTEAERRLDTITQLCAEAERPFWGYAASAKATVLLNALASRGAPLPEWIIDDAPQKQGMLVPGVRVPVVAPEAMDKCRTLMVLAWNWADGIKLRARNRGFQGDYLIPLPTPRMEHV